MPPGGSLIATGGRVLNVVAVASDFRTARDTGPTKRSPTSASTESHYRTDIAARVAE